MFSDTNLNNSGATDNVGVIENGLVVTKSPRTTLSSITSNSKIWSSFLTKPNLS